MIIWYQERIALMGDVTIETFLEGILNYKLLNLFFKLTNIDKNKKVTEIHFNEYEKLFDIEHICNAVENAFEQKCPICGAEMIVKEGDEGGIYWQCVEGDYSRNANQQYPVDGILRCKCGAPYVFVMKNEPRWVCSADSKHYQKMRESDLKLEKMLALIPTKTARKEVDKYFAMKRKAVRSN